MAHFEVEALIPASPEAVWAVLADLERHGEWMVDIRELRLVSEQKEGAGAVMDATSALFGLPIIKDLIEVTVWEPPRRMEVRRATPRAGFGRIALQGTGSIVLEPEGSGTRVRWREDVRAPLGWLGEAAFALVVRPYVRWVFGRSLANLRRLAVERAASRTAAGS